MEFCEKNRRQEWQTYSQRSGENRCRNQQGLCNRGIASERLCTPLPGTMGREHLPSGSQSLTFVVGMCHAPPDLGWCYPLTSHCLPGHAKFTQDPKKLPFFYIFGVIFLMGTQHIQLNTLLLLTEEKGAGNLIQMF